MTNSHYYIPGVYTYVLQCFHKNFRARGVEEGLELYTPHTGLVEHHVYDALQLHIPYSGKFSRVQNFAKRLVRPSEEYFAVFNFVGAITHGNCGTDCT